MRIFQREADKIFNNLGLYFTDSEVKELSIEFEKLLNDPDNYLIRLKGEDANGQFTKEILIRIYTDSNIEQFDDRVKEIIRNNR